jgi:hypothetical protein
VPKLSDKLIGTSVGGEIEDVTYNFTLQELLDVFLPVIPANNLQGILDYGNTATQDINLFGTITTTNLEVTDTANLFITYLNEETHIVGSVFDSADSVGTAGQVLTSTGEGVEWFTLPPIFTPNLQQVLEVGNTAEIDILLDANIQALDVSSDTANVSSQLTIQGVVVDYNESAGGAGQVLSSTSTSVEWVNLPVYSATSPLLFNPATGVFSIQVANSTQSGYLSSSDWITFNGKQNAGSYITALTGEATATGPGSVPITLNNASVINKVLTGLNVTGGNVLATDSILTAFGKVQNQINGLVGGVQYQGTWDAATNTPTLTSSVGTQGYYYIVSVDGNTNLNGITDWKVGDWAIFSGGVWQKVDNTDSVTSVNGFTGAVSLTTDNIPEGTTNLYFLNSRARAAVSATSPLLYNNTTGVFSIQQASGIQNGFLSSTDWTTFNSKQDYLGGTGLVKSTAGTITYITDNSSNWNTAYNRSLTSAAVTGTGTKTLTLNQQDGGTIQASWTDLGLTSVGVSMPSAFNVANSPLTANGTIAITGAGVASQYIRGDGTLAVLPTGGGGGGASVSYYLNGSINQGTIGGVTYYEMNRTPVFGAGTDFSRNTNGYIASFLTDANDPALLSIPAGNWNFETYFNASSGGGSPTFYIELYKYDGVVFTLVASNSTNPKLINDGTNIEAYFSALAVPQTTLTLTDRLAIRIYVTTAGRTITLDTENGHLCQVITTFTTGLTALNGLTAQVQYLATGTSGTDFNIASATATHTFNLPTASATNRGALSSSDWSVFNAKQNALTLTTTGTSGAATLVGATLNIPQYTDQFVGTVTSVAALTLGTSGTDLSSTVANSTTTPVITLNVPTASATNRGALSSADWTTFNNKQAALSGTGFVKISGTTISYDNSTYYLASNPNAYIPLTALSAGAGISYNNTTGVIASTITQYTDALARAAISLTTTGTSGAATYNNTTGVLNIPQYAPDLSGYVPTSRTLTINGTAFDLSANRSWSVGSVTSVGLSSATSGVTIGSTPITTSGTITLAIATASGSQQGLLSSTDWTTFNNKQNALTNPVTGTGTTNTLPKFTGASTIGNSNITDTGSLITLGSNSYVNGNLGVGITASSTWGRTGFEIGISGASLTREVRDLVLLSNSIWTSTGLVYAANAGAGRFDVGVSNFRWYTAPSGTAGNAITFTQAMTLFNTGNLALNTTTDAGFRLDVNGTARVQGVITGSVASGTLTLGAAAANSQAIIISGYFTSGGAISTSNSNNRGYDARINVQDGGAFWASGHSNGQAVNNTNAFFRGTGTINIANGTVGNNFNGVLFDPTITAQVNTVIYAFRSTLAAATDRWNLYMAGTAANYLAGKLLIGTTSDNGALLQVQGSATISSTLTTNGSVIINPTAAANSFIRLSYSGTNFGLIGSGSVLGGSANNMIVYAYGNNPISLYTNNIERVTISGTGNLLVGTTTDIASASVVINSTTQGFLPPRMTLAQRTAIASPATGLIVYQTDGVEGLWLNTSTGWRELTVV